MHDPRSTDAPQHPPAAHTYQIPVRVVAVGSEPTARALRWADRNVGRALGRAHKLDDPTLVLDLRAAQRDLAELAELLRVRR